MPAATPNRAAGGAWPGDANGLVFAWQNAKQANQIVDFAGQLVRICRAVARGRARLGRFYDMLPAGGSFAAEGMDDALLHSCRRSGQLTLEAVLTPPDKPADPPATILAFGGERGQVNFALRQWAGKLILSIRTTDADGNRPAELELCDIAAGKPQHVVISHSAGRTLCWLDGRQVADSAAIRGGFGNWTPQHLVFGSDWDGGRAWPGRLEGIAIYARALGAAEAGRKWELIRPRLAVRKPIPRVVIMGRCTEVTPTPSLEKIHPYRRCLTYFTYEVQQVLEGKLTDKRIVAGRWAILDGKPLEAARQKGQVYRLALEAESDHPELDMERKVMVQDELNMERYLEAD